MDYEEYLFCQVQHQSNHSVQVLIQKFKIRQQNQERMQTFRTQTPADNGSSNFIKASCPLILFIQHKPQHSFLRTQFFKTKTAEDFYCGLILIADIVIGRS